MLNFAQIDMKISFTYSQILCIEIDPCMHKTVGCILKAMLRTFKHGSLVPGYKAIKHECLQYAIIVNCGSVINGLGGINWMVCLSKL